MSPHAVILDIEMPVMGGFDAASAIRKELGEAAPWLIAIGGHPSAIDAAAGGSLFDHALHKPVESCGSLLGFCSRQTTQVPADDLSELSGAGADHAWQPRSGRRTFETPRPSRSTGRRGRDRAPGLVG